MLVLTVIKAIVLFLIKHIMTGSNHPKGAPSSLNPTPLQSKYVATNIFLLFLCKRCFCTNIFAHPSHPPGWESLLYITVVGNPRGSWGFGKILLKGVLGVVKKCSGSPFCVLLHFYDKTFQILPLLPPPPRVHLWLYFLHLLRHHHRCTVVVNPGGGSLGFFGKFY